MLLYISPSQLWVVKTIRLYSTRQSINNVRTTNNFIGIRLEYRTRTKAPDWPEYLLRNYFFWANHKLRELLVERSIWIYDMMVILTCTISLDASEWFWTFLLKCSRSSVKFSKAMKTVRFMLSALESSCYIVYIQSQSELLGQVIQWVRTYPRQFLLHTECVRELPNATEPFMDSIPYS